MLSINRPLLCLILLVFSVFCSTQAFALADKDNQGRWTTPTENNLPDKEVPGFLVNLGPTGARAVLTEKTFIVRYIFKDAPALNHLKLEDEIIGAFGKPFSEHTFKGGRGYEGPVMDFGAAIEKAESKDGKLVLNVKRGSEILEVIVPLEAIGSFSTTYPYHCKKSDTVRAKALKYFAEHPDALNVWQAHARSAVALALITSDDPKQAALGKDMVLKWAGQSPDAGTWTWGLSYQLITLAEYHLLTKDTSVLPMMKTVVGFLERAQYSGRILVWGPQGDKALQKEDYSKVDEAQQLYDGGFGHGPYKPGIGPATGGFGPNGYGPMQYTTILAVTAWQLAERCKVEVKADSIKRALEFIHRGTNAAGYVAYGGEFTLNGGLVDAVKWKSSTGGDNYVGRTGCAIVAHKLSPEYPESADYLVKYKSYMKHAANSMPNGHADSNLGIFWGIMGAAAAEDDTVLRAVLDYHKLYFNMMRCHDGSFVLLPGRDYADNGYYMASRYHPTGTMILAYGLNNPKLLIQGIQVSIPGINPKALTGKLDIAYKAIVAKSYKDAIRFINSVRGAKTISSEDTAVCAALTTHIETLLLVDMNRLAALEKSGDLYTLSLTLESMNNNFDALPSYKEKTLHFTTSLKEESWKNTVKLGASYAKLLATLNRTRSPTSTRALESFAQKNPDTLYGKWAAEIAAAFRAHGVIPDPATDLTAK